jgi:hypothetical protein
LLPVATVPSRTVYQSQESQVYYYRRLRQHQVELELTPRAAADSSSPPVPQSPASADPFHNLREQREKKQSDGFTYDPFSIQKQLID